MKVAQTATAFMLLLPPMLALTGCAVMPPHDHAYVSDAILQRSGGALAPDNTSHGALPPSVDVADGVTADEAVAIALWNNPELQVDLSGLGFTRADLLEAGLLPNPVFSVLFPVGPKQFEATLTMPVEVLWQRSHRVAAARSDAEAVAQNLVQHGLELVRRLRTTFIHLRLAREKCRLANAELELQTEAARIAGDRLGVGDISAAAVAACRLTVARAREQAVRATHEARRETIALQGLLGWRADNVEFVADAPSTNPVGVASTDVLLKRALASRPDVRAAELAIEAAGQRVGLERSKVFDLTVILDANGDGDEGFEAGPGLRFSLPVLDRNQGGVARSRAELEHCVRRYLAVKERIATEILQAHADHAAATEVLSVLKREVVRASEEATRHAEQAYAAGNASYVELLVARQQKLQAQIREAEAEAALQRSLVNLAFSVGSADLQSD